MEMMAIMRMMFSMAKRRKPKRNMRSFLKSEVEATKARKGSEHGEGY